MSDQSPVTIARVHARQPKVHLIRQDQMDAVLIQVREADPASPRAMGRVVQDFPQSPPELAMYALPDDRTPYGSQPTPEEVAQYGLRVPETLMDALYVAMAAERGDTQEMLQALRAAEDRLEERDAELAEMTQELAMVTEERNRWEVLCLAKDELSYTKDAVVDAIHAHLETAQGQAADWKGLQVETAGELNAAVGEVNMLREALNTPTYFLPEQQGPTLFTCGGLSPEGLGGPFQPPRHCTIPGGPDAHRTVAGSPIHTDGHYTWGDGFQAGPTDD